MKKTPKAAFPAVTGIELRQSGMTLRDYFAGQALAGLVVGSAHDALVLGDGETIDEALPRFWSGTAQVAYIIADAMLAAREPSHE